jgi:hypothetical protein
MRLSVASWTEEVDPSNVHSGVISFLELSVFDCGPGFAERITGKALTSLSIESEIEATSSCFKEGVTSTGERGSGHGLTNVLRAVSELNGIFRVRTGRVSVWASYHNWSPTKREEILGRLRVTSRGNVEHHQTVGSVTSVLVPILRLGTDRRL